MPRTSRRIAEAFPAGLRRRRRPPPTGNLGHRSRWWLVSEGLLGRDPVIGAGGRHHATRCREGVRPWIAVGAADTVRARRAAPGRRALAGGRRTGLASGLPGHRR